MRIPAFLAGLVVRSMPRRAFRREPPTAHAVAGLQVVHTLDPSAAQVLAHLRDYNHLPLDWAQISSTLMMAPSQTKAALAVLLGRGLIVTVPSPYGDRYKFNGRER